LAFEAEYLYCWARGAYLPPLVTQSADGTALENAGILGEPGTELLYGDGLTSVGPRSGLRLRGRMALGSAREWWLVAEGFGLPPFDDEFVAGSTGPHILARPFYDEAIDGPNSELVSFPGFVDGLIEIEASNELWGAGITLQRNLLCYEMDEVRPELRIDLLVGYRFLELSDRVRINEHLTGVFIDGPLLLGTRFDITDDYSTQSRFHGVDLGIRGQWTRGRYFLDGELRAALGQTDHCLDVHGFTGISVPGVGSVAFPGGLLASGDMMGQHRDREFSVVPQAELRLGRQFTDHLRLSVGYTFLYWSQVVRAGEQIGATIDSSALPSAGSEPVPAQSTPLSSSSFWMHGITANLEWRY